MIKLDFAIAISLFFFLFLVIILLVWLFAKKQKSKDLSLDPRFIWHCAVCTYTYINTKEEKFSTCPRCASYNKRSLAADK
ncbi:hypothetical protein ACFLZ3_00090 [Candidatus Omnitrophota bacterium]